MPMTIEEKRTLLQHNKEKLLSIFEHIDLTEAERSAITGIVNSLHEETTSNLISAIQKAVNQKKVVSAVEESAEQKLLNSKENMFGIYQLKQGDSYRNYRWESFDDLADRGLEVDITNYDLVYVSPLNLKNSSGETLNSLYEQFNQHRPVDFKGHSLSMSDVIVLQIDGQTTASYLNRFGFKELPSFIDSKERVANDLISFFRERNEYLPVMGLYSGSVELLRKQLERIMQEGSLEYERIRMNLIHEILSEKDTDAISLLRRFDRFGNDNPLKTVEMSSEANFNMIDGVINNEPTPSALEQIRSKGTTTSKQGQDIWESLGELTEEEANKYLSVEGLKKWHELNEQVEERAIRASREREKNQF